jgi:hypothetical protein
MENGFRPKAAFERPRSLCSVLLIGLSIVGCGGPPDPKPGISFRATPETILAGGSSVLSWSVAGADEITIDHSVGPVAPIATAVVTPPSTATYTLTARNSAGTTTATCSVTVQGTVAPPSNLTYSLSPAVYVTGSAISPNTPSTGGGTVASYSVSPALPAGLSLDTSTGVISGRPAVATASAVYVVTATNAAGSTAVNLTIAVTATLLPPSNLTYSLNPAVYVTGTAVAPNTPSSSGGAVASYSVSPALPAGLSLDASAGVISGTPAVATASAVYVVTATNAAGSTAVNLTITVNAALVPELWYSFDGTGANSGTLTGYSLSTFGTTSFVAGKFGLALQFGTGGYATVTGMRALLGAAAQATIAFWMYQSAQLSAQAFWDDDNRQTAPYGGVQLGQTAGQISVCASTTSNAFLGGSCNGFASPSVLAWHHWLIRYSGTGTGAGQGGPVEIYVDGALVHTRANDVSNDPVFTATGIPDAMTIGGNGGIMDDLRIYSRTFTQAEQCTRIIGGSWSGSACTLP